MPAFIPILETFDIAESSCLDFFPFSVLALLDTFIRLIGLWFHIVVDLLRQMIKGLRQG